MDKKIIDVVPIETVKEEQFVEVDFEITNEALVCEESKVEELYYKEKKLFKILKSNLPMSFNKRS